MASPIAALVVRVLADVSEMKESVKGIETSLGGLKESVGKSADVMNLLSSAVLRFAGPAVIGAAIRQAIDYGGRMTDMAAKTGVAVEQLGKLEFAATQSGGSIEQVTDAISQMQKRLVGGNDSTVSALGQLHLRLTDILKLTPDEQFRTLARALADVKDPALQAKLAMDLFGRAGADLLPTLKALADGVGDDVVAMGKQTAETLDWLGDKWDAFVARMGVAVANVTAMTVESVQAIYKWTRDVAMAPITAGFSQTPGLPGRPGLATNAPLETLAVPENPWKGMADDLEDVNQKLREQQRIRKELGQTPDGLLQTRAVGGRRGSLVPGLSGVSLGDLDSMIGSVGLDPMTFGKGPMELLSRNFGPGSWGLAGGGSKGGGFFGNVFGGIKDSGQGFLQGLTGGKGVSGLFTNLGSGLLTGGLSSLMGAGIGLAGKGISKAWGALTHREERQVNDARDTFQAENFGSFDEMAAAADKAGYSIEKLLDAKKMSDFNNEVEAFTKALDDADQAARNVDDAVGGVKSAVQAAGGSMPDDLKETINSLAEMKGLTEEQRQAIRDLAVDAAPDFEALQRRADDFGITIDQLGPKFRQANIDKDAANIVDTFGDLTKAGADAGGVLAGMSDEVSGLVSEAKKYGLELPENLKPIAEAMLGAGQLVDENGQKIKDLNDISWKETPLDEGTTAIVDAIKELKETLLRLPGVAREAAQGMNDEFARVNDIDVDVNYNDPGMPNRPDLPGYANGTGGRFIDFGAGTPVMLHGRERVMTERESGGGGGGAVIDNTIYLDGDVLYRALDRRQSRELRDGRLLRMA